MGWYMVESGLIDQPDVSHFRLSVHLNNCLHHLFSTIVLFLEYSFRKKKAVNDYKRLQNQLT